MAKTFDHLPEGCIATIISLTTPLDACRLSLVSRIFGSAAQSDAVWERFLPPDYLSIVSRSLHPPLPRTKDYYFSLCDHPVLIDQGRKSFSLDKESGKKCYMLSARELSIAWGDTPCYWRWIPLPKARFEEVAELLHVWWLEIKGKIDVSMLSPSTLYTANLVFKLTARSYGLNQAGNAAVGLVEGEKFTRTVLLDANRRQRRNRNIESRTSTPRGRDNDHNYPKKRGDGWMETELGEFFYDGKQDGDLEMSLLDKSSCLKGGLIVQGIEIRPKKV